MRISDWSSDVCSSDLNGSVGNDLIGYLLRANDDGRMLDDAKITELIRQFLPAAAETTTRSFGSLLVALLERHALLDRVRADPTLVPKVITVGMRWETHSQYLARQATADLDIRCVPKIGRETGWERG